MATHSSLPLVLFALLATACSSIGGSDPHHFAPLGAYRRATSTQSSTAQYWFDQGLLWTYGFNHDEAVHCFQTAQREDPGFALAYWGEGFARGPNINAPLTDTAAAKAAFDATHRAVELRAHASPVEQALIDALALRYADPAPNDRKALDLAFMDAMRDVRHRFPDDADVGALFADSILNTRPWDYWTAEGQPQPGAIEALDTLRAVIRNYPSHPGAHHFHIHVTEASPNPDDGLMSAQVLESLVPLAGHLVHMPAHTLQRVGRYYEAEEHNTRAIEADRAYFRAVGPQGIYHFYLAHNHHFRVWSAMYGGRFAVARAAARDLVADLPPNALTDFAAFADGFLPVELHVLLRFGKWDEALAVSEFGENLPIARTLRHYARGIAFAALGKLDEAKREKDGFEVERTKIASDAQIGINPAKPVIELAAVVLNGETRYREGQFDEAFALLREAVTLEDRLRYDEPSPWMMPVRHALGALLLEQGRVEEAEHVYTEDLARNRDNGWSLHGLLECQQKLGRTAEAEATKARFLRAWAHADTQLEHGSCFCRTAQSSESCCAELPSLAVGEH